jgi:hypothetical protein
LREDFLPVASPLEKLPEGVRNRRRLLEMRSFGHA